MIKMNLKEIIKFYIHGLALTIIGLAFSYLTEYIDINTDLGLTLSIILLFIVLPCTFAGVNAYLFRRLYNLVIIYTRKTLINFFVDGLTLMLLVLVIGIFISKMCMISSLVNIILSIITPLVFGYSAYKLTGKLYNLY